MISHFSSCKTIPRTVKKWDRGSTTFLPSWYLLYLHWPNCDAPRLQVPGSKRTQNWDHFNYRLYYWKQKHTRYKPGRYSPLFAVDECFIHSWLIGFQPANVESLRRGFRHVHSFLTRQDSFPWQICIVFPSCKVRCRNFIHQGASSAQGRVQEQE